MINYTPVLNQVLGMAQMLAFSAGPIVSGGVVIVTTLAEILNNAFGPGGEDEVTTAMQNLGAEIEAHMDDLFTDLVLELKQLKMDDAKDVVSGMATELADQQTVVKSALGTGVTTDLAAAVAVLMTHAKSAIDGESPISQVIEFCKDNGTIDNGYATLPLLFGAVLGLANYCKYAVQIQVQLDAKNYIAALKAPKPADPSAPKPPLPDPPDGKHGDALVLNSYIFNKLQETIAFALPSVLAINKAVVAREKNAMAAAAKVQVTGNTLSPSVAISNPTTDTPTYAGFADSGYGALSPNNLKVMAMLLNAQYRRISWLNSTASDNIYQFGTAEVLSLNYALSTLNESAKTYYSMLPPVPSDPITAPPDLLAGIYPKPTPYIVQTGDTLTALATRFHTTVATIVQLNDIVDPSVIAVGESLTIPNSA